VLDTSALLGGSRRYLIAAAALRQYDGYWSSWIIAEFVRKRTEWVADRAAREKCNHVELRRRLRNSRQVVNRLVDELSSILLSVDYRNARAADLDWLTDPDDRPVMLTAISAKANVLVTDNTADFPAGERRNGILILTSDDFLERLYRSIPDAKETVRDYLESR
jgi:predicted nucleic acid-binding protein